MKLQENRWNSAMRDMVKAKEQLQRTIVAMNELGDRFVHSSRRDIRGIMVALQDADSAMAQVEVIQWLENEKGN